MQGSYNYYLVVLSLAVAMLSSYTALDLAARIQLLELAQARRLRWLVGGAVSMGIGIWSMHFIGMLAFEMSIPLGYDLRETMLSLVIAIGFSYFALVIVTRKNLSKLRLTASAAVFGLGIASMHYVGMLALRMHPSLTYRTDLVCASIAIAIVASWLALSLAAMQGNALEGRQKSYSQTQILLRRSGAGLVMGLAIAGMHYTGMGAAIFAEGSLCAAASGSSKMWIAISVAVPTITVLFGTLIFSVVDRRFDAHTTSMMLRLQQANTRLEVMATKDALTSVPNRVALMESLKDAIERAELDASNFTIMFVDLDGFKTINDSLGHSAGDNLLMEFAEGLKKCVRRTDVVARLGGDEFVVLLDHVGLHQEIAPMAEAILGRMQQDFVVNGTPLRLTTSMGIATYPQDGTEPEELLKNADIAMYDAKRAGKNTYRYFDVAMSAAAARTLKIYHGLSEAIQKNEMYIHFQPKFDGTTQEMTGAEALIRWHHPELGNIPPLSFIPIAEQTGQIIGLGNWVISEVCKQLKRWDDRGLSRITIAINLSPEQLRLPLYVKKVQDIISASGISADRIMFEITETVAMKDAELSAEVIRQFQSAGFEIGIDDFGTGYSSLAYLQQFRVKQLKIDRFFVNGLDEHGGEGLAIVSAIIAMAHSLDMVVVAEGVETNSQLATLKALNCDQLQGFLLGKPVGTKEFENLLTEDSGAESMAGMEMAPLPS